MGWLRRLRGTIATSGVSREFDEEARFHFDELVDEYTRQGMTPDVARLQAQRRLGNLTLTRERTRDADTLRWLTDLGKDVRFAGRTLRKNPGFAAVAIVTLALGIGANTAIFSLFDAILLQQLPVRDPSRLVLFSGGQGEGTSTGDPPTGRWQLFSDDVYRDLRGQPLPYESLAAVRSGEAGVLVHVPSEGSAAAAERGQAHLVSGNYFETMGVQAAIGRTLTMADDRPGAPPVTVVSDGFWRQHLHADPDIVGRTVILNTTAFTIVGVTPREFFGERVRRPPDFWMPLVFQPQIELRPAWDRADAYWLDLIGRLAPRATPAQAAAATTTALRRFLTAQAGAKLTPDRRKDIQGSRIELTSGAGGISGLRYRYSQPLRVLLVVVGLVLLIACANVANLLLTRAVARRSEISMRVALGASRTRLVRQLLTESLLLALIGAAGGVLIAKWATGALLALVTSATTPVHAGLSAPVLVFTVVVALVAGVLFGIAPALHASRVDLVSAMKTRQGAGGSGRGRSRAAGILVAVQIAVSLVLLVGANLFARSLMNIEHQPLGFDADHVLLTRINPRLAGYTPAAAWPVYARLWERLGTLPGVRAATIARYSPFGGSTSTNSGRVEGYTPKPGEDVALETIPVGPSYPEAMGLPILQGRAITIRDVAGGPKVGMVNAAFVRRYLPNVNPIGRHFGLDRGAPPDIEIVGVLGDALFHDVREPIDPIVFTALLQEDSQFALDAEIAVRTAGNPAGLAAAVRAAVAETDRNLPVNDPKTLASQVSNTFNSQRLAAQFVGFFGLLALTLACVGLYGTIAQNVSQRTNEIGVRLALGAERGGLVWMILRQTVVLLVAGLAAGLPSAWLASHLIASQLFAVPALDPVSFGAAVGLLALVALVAGFVPARRATRVNPVLALRAE